MAKVKYVRLGEKARSFADPYSGLVLSGKMVVKVTPKQLASQKVSRAMLGGHLTAADQDEYDEWVKFEASTRTDLQSKTAASNAELLKENEELKARIKELESIGDDEPNFDKMKGPALIKYYEENFEVTESQVAEFSKMVLEEKRALLKELDQD